MFSPQQTHRMPPRGIVHRDQNATASSKSRLSSSLASFSQSGYKTWCNSVLSRQASSAPAWSPQAERMLLSLKRARAFSFRNTGLFPKIRSASVICSLFVRSVVSLASQKYRLGALRGADGWFVPGYLGGVISQKVASDSDMNIPGAVVVLANGALVLPQRSPVVRQALLQHALGFFYIAQRMEKSAGSIWTASQLSILELVWMSVATTKVSLSLT